MPEPAQLQKSLKHRHLTMTAIDAVLTFVLNSSGTVILFVYLLSWALVRVLHAITRWQGRSVAAEETRGRAR